MDCPSCGTANREGRRFCLECGAPLAAACPSCGTTNEPGARFCGSCGSALDGAPAADAAPRQPADTTPAASAAASTPAERRIVSVLFADLVGFTPRSEGADPEDTRELLSRYFVLARDVIERYGGSVEKFIGDAVMAVWGAPVAHEDDAERAVRAALELTDAVGALGDGERPLRARAGVLTGEAAVTVGAVGEGMVAGDLVNSAARLQSIAPEGAVLVGEGTMRATRAAVAYEAHGEHEVKGREAPLAAWRALRVVAQRRGAGRTEAPETPFVGRQEELRLLKDQLRLTGRDPRPRLVAVTGPAGIGKSRLAWELEKYADGVVERIAWHRGRSPAYGEGVAFWAVGEMVRGRARIAEADDEATTRTRVEATVAEYVAEDERTWVTGALLALLGHETTEAHGRDLLFAAWRRFFEGIAAQGTVVMVFEDLHWADAGTLDFIEHLLDWSRSSPIMVVCLARPELFERRPSLGAGRRNVTSLVLDPLAADEMRELVAALVPDLPVEARDEVIGRANGIPLYAVELVRQLVAEGRLEPGEEGYRARASLAGMAVPETLRSLITARLDALEAEDRSIVQHAAVLGQSFTVEALAATAGRDASELHGRLRALVQRQFLSLDQDPRSPERGQYGFVQSLIREVAYATLARADRRSRHLAAARYFEQQGTDELAGVLAGHYVAAHEASQPGPERDAVATQARLALRGAADRASKLGSHGPAAAYLEQALALATDPADRAALLEAAGNERDEAGGHARATDLLRQAIDLYAAIPDPRGVATARTALGIVLVHAGAIAEAIVELERAIDELPDGIDPEVRANALAKLARALYRGGHDVRSVEASDAALVIAEGESLVPVIADALVSKGTAMVSLGRPTEARALLEAGIELARDQGSIQDALRGMTNIQSVVGPSEGPLAALAISREGQALAARVGNLQMHTWHLSNVSPAAIFGALPLASAIAEFDAFVDDRLETFDRLQLLGRRAALAALRGDDVSDVLAELRAADELRSDPQHEFEILWVEAMAAFARGDLARALEIALDLGRRAPRYPLWTMAGSLAALLGEREQLARLLDEGQAHVSLGQLWRATRNGWEGALAALDGEREEAASKFRRALQNHMDPAGADWHGALLRWTWLVTVGPDDPDARAAGEQALAIYERMEAHPLAAQVRAALAGAPSTGRAERPILSG